MQSCFIYKQASDTCCVKVGNVLVFASLTDHITMNFNYLHQALKVAVYLHVSEFICQLPRA